MAGADLVRPVLETALADSGLVLEDVVVTPAGRRRVVRVLLDRDLPADGTVTEPTEPLSLDEVADATRLVSDALDADDVLGEQPYTLEVSSPGVGRPLTEPRHFRRNVGRLLTVRTGGPDGTDLTGRLVEAGPDWVVLDVPATRTTPGGPTTLPTADLERAVVEVEFGRPDDPKES